MSFSVDRILGIDKQKLSTLCMYPNKMTEIKGIERNFLDSVDTNFYIPSEYEESLPKFYLDNGQIDGIKCKVDNILISLINEDFFSFKK